MAGLQEESVNAQEINFRRLYNDVLTNFIQSNSISEEEIDSAIVDIIESFKWKGGYANRGSYRNVDYSLPKNLLGFISRYAPHGAGLARYKILEALPGCPELMFVLQKPHLNVACLGGGPANDAIGFCCALSEYSFKGNLSICIVDSIQQWSDYVDEVKRLLMQGDYGRASDLFQQKRADLNFKNLVLPCDLSFLCDYDIILMCKLFSIMSDEDQKQLISVLHAAMKVDALLLFIDTPFIREFWLDKFQLLYISAEDVQPYLYCPPNTDCARFGHRDAVKSKARIAILKKIATAM